MVNILDHIIHLSAPGELQRTVERFKDLGFRVLPGGKHADGLTENALIVLVDGVYIELISFTHPVSYYPVESAERKAREEHWWGSMRENGWIDFSLGDLTPDEEPSISTAINTRAQANGVDLVYDKGVEGGRIKPDGEEIRWIVTFPARKHLRGGVPFFTKDLTPRFKRVPWDGSNISATATETEPTSRISSLTLMAAAEHLSTRSKEISAALGTQPFPVLDAEGGQAWLLDSPEAPQSIQLRLVPASDEEQLAWIQSVGGIGVREVGIKVLNAENEFPGQGLTSLGVGDIGKISWIFAK